MKEGAEVRNKRIVENNERWREAEKRRRKDYN